MLEIVVVSKFNEKKNVKRLKKFRYRVIKD